MNTGIIDAVVLGQLLGDVVNGVRPEAELDLYETLRRPAAEEVLELAGTMTDMALTRSPVKRFVRNLVLSVLNLNSFLRRRIALK
ncbi:MAG: pentachlorophenol monooxygenase, partial [Mesorhizobium sp.]